MPTRGMSKCISFWGAVRKLVYQNPCNKTAQRTVFAKAQGPRQPAGPPPAMTLRSGLTLLLLVSVVGGRARVRTFVLQQNETTSRTYTSTKNIKEVQVWEEDWRDEAPAVPVSVRALRSLDKRVRRRHCSSNTKKTYMMHVQVLLPAI